MDNQESVPSRSVTFTKGNKGGQQCHLEGYIYTYEKTSKNGNRQWRCKDMKGFTPTCKGRITTCGELATRSSPHCHPSSDIEVQVQTFLSSVKEDCCTDTTSNVIRKKLLDTPEDVQCFLPSMRNMKQSVYRARTKARGTSHNPRTIEELVIDLPARQDASSGLFVLEDVCTSTGKRVIALASEKTLNILNKNHSLLFLDGTFKISPALFRQLWIIRGFASDSDDSIVIPLLYFLLEDKAKTSYTAALEIVKDNCPDINVASFMMDFELAEQKATAEVFPLAITRGCLFHWKKRLLERFRMIPEYHSNASLRYELHAVFGVAFVPVSDVPRAWQQVKTTLAGLPSTQPFVTYFEATWMNGPYPHQIWNHYQAALNDEPRTNNFSEGSNYSLNVAVACNNPSPARLVDSLVAFNSETELVILQGMTGMEQKRKILKRYRDLNQRLKSSVQAYHNVPMAFYCRSIGHLNSA